MDWGSIDSTGAVSASASLIGQDVLHFAIVIKILQNVTEYTDRTNCSWNNRNME